MRWRPLVDDPPNRSEFRLRAETDDRRATGPPGKLDDAHGLTDVGRQVVRLSATGAVDTRPGQVKGHLRSKLNRRALQVGRLGLEDEDAISHSLEPPAVALRAHEHGDLIRSRQQRADQM